MGQFGSFPDFWRVLCVPGNSWVFVQGLSWLPPGVRRGQKTMDTRVPKLLLLHLRHPYLLSDSPTGFCIRFWGSSSAALKKSVSNLWFMYSCFVSLHNLGAALSHSPWNWKTHFSLRPSPQTELIFTKLPGFLRWVATDLVYLYQSLFICGFLDMASFKNH